MFWDINLGEIFDLPPWEVRDKITVSDVARMRIWNDYKKYGRDTSVDLARQKTELEAQMNRR